MELLDRSALLAELERRDLSPLAEVVRQFCQQRYSQSHHGQLPTWSAAWNHLPDPKQGNIEASANAVKVPGSLPDDNRQALTEALMKFHPWRKGPFEFFGQPIDTEWRSDWKWNRLAAAIDFRNRSVLDIGCGNGYYGWKMLNAGADFVLGCDPTTLFNLQFEVFRRYSDQGEWKDKHFVVPIADSELPPKLAAFDLTFSMGVLYHRTSPIDHLQTLFGTLRPGGKAVVETLVLESEQREVLFPEGRYAKMRNTWFIPSVPMLTRWMSRVGFRDLEVIDVSPTTTQEQRKTDWMTFESLADFLDPENSSRTIEGHPAPIRAIVSGVRR